MRAPTPLLLVVLTCAGAGCAAAVHPESLDDAVRSYNDGLRWERLTMAATQVPPKEREAFVDQRDKLAENLKLTDWEMVDVHKEGALEARVQVKITWYEDDRGVLHTTRAEQRWELHGSSWWIVDEHRLRGDVMPGLPEPETGDKADKRDAADARDPGDKPDVDAADPPEPEKPETSLR